MTTNKFRFVGTNQHDLELVFVLSHPVSECSEFRYSQTDERLLIQPIVGKPPLTARNQVAYWLQGQVSRGAQGLAVELARIFVGEPTDAWKKWNAEKSKCITPPPEPDRVRPWPSGHKLGENLSVDLD